MSFSRSKCRYPRWLKELGATAISVLLVLSAGPIANAQPLTRPLVADQAVYVTAHVDVTAEHTQQAIGAIRDYVAAARRQAGVLRIEAVQETRPNHFDLIEVWRSPAAYNAHEADAATIYFHDQIYPWRGSPLEERLGQQIAP